MRLAATILFTLKLCIANSTTYYVSAGGNDGNSGTSQGSAWQTLGKVNTFSTNLNPGDQILFERGGTYFGHLVPPTNGSGSTSGTVTIGAYGSGSKPILTALKTLSLSGGTGNIYTATLSPESEPELLLINGQLQAIGRWPNADAANNGYFKVDNVIESKPTMKIVDNEFGTYGSPLSSWVGAEMMIRVNRFLLNNFKIQAQSNSGNQATFTIPWVQSPQKMGYFIQNHVKCLDRQGEWSYSGNTASVYLTGSTSGVQMPVYDNIVSLTGINYWTFDNIVFTGANKNAISTNSGSNIRITNCEFYNNGRAAIDNYKTSKMYVGDCIIDNSLSFGIAAEFGSTTVENSTISNTTPISGMGAGGNSAGSGINLIGSDYLIQYNHINNSGYAGVDFNRGSNIIMQYNVVDGFCLKTDDAGAFYTVNQVADFTKTNRIVRQNIIKHSQETSPLIGTFEKTFQTYALYADNYTDRVTWEGNIVDGAYIGWFANDPFNNTVTNNFFYNVVRNNIHIRNAHTTYPIKGNAMSGNVFFSTLGTGSRGMSLIKVQAGSVSGYGTFNGNYYVRPYNSSEPFQSTIAGNSIQYFLPGWRSTYGFEGTGAITPKVLSVTQPAYNYTQFLYNETKQSKTYALTGDWMNHKGEAVTGSITLQPFTAAALIWGTGVQPPDNPPPPPPPPPTGTLKARTKYKIINVILP